MPTALSVSPAATREGLRLRTAHQGAGRVFHITRVLDMRLRLISVFLHLGLSVSLPFLSLYLRGGLRLLDGTGKEDFGEMLLKSRAQSRAVIVL